MLGKFTVLYNKHNAKKLHETEPGDKKSVVARDSYDVSDDEEQESKWI